VGQSSPNFGEYSLRYFFLFVYSTLRFILKIFALESRDVVVKQPQNTVFMEETPNFGLALSGPLRADPWPGRILVEVRVSYR